MVYCGPPSRGCETCRTRKIKCDQKPLPLGCSQCAKSKRQCLGYRDVQSVLFRDESAKITKVTKRGERRKCPAVIASTATVTRRDAGRRDDNMVAPTKQLPTQTAAKQTSVSLQPYLSPSLDDQATGFCFTHFLNHVIFSTNVISQFGDQTADVWRWGVDDRLLTSLKTIGFAGLYYQTRHPGFERLARYHYLKAVHIVNETLSDHKQAISDSMLLSIIILSQFESMCGPAEDYLSAWETHMHGAVSLIIMRGRSQMSTAIGRRLFMSITTSLLTSCLQRRCPFPPSLEEIMKATSHELMAKSLPWRLTEIMIDIANLRASYQHGLRQDLAATIQMALHLDSKLISTEGSLPPSWTFQVMEFSVSGFAAFFSKS
ncbi:hypothetical protein E4T39_06874 [Aureobasidium subglaciale]|nr:hypothetical protein E4T39_06874 [Aureobasidium subglaciale]